MKNEKAGRQTGSKQNHLIAGGNQTNFQFESNINAGKLQSDLTEHLKQHRKIRRLYRCFSCEKPKSLLKMSSFPFLCRECLKSFGEKGKTAQGNFIERVKSKIGKFLREAVV